MSIDSCCGVHAWQCSESRTYLLIPQKSYELNICYYSRFIEKQIIPGRLCNLYKAIQSGNNITGYKSLQSDVTD
jgi:hypothetical protein